ncbi:MAG: carbon-nitrogen hydrolase family protein [Candidatus Zapsychrus exili]|nr:carbon-nitrogen hydrolase family protein [Candidatus Zapsychrus exili]
MKIATIQFNSTDNKVRNIKEAVRLVEKAAKAGAQFILLPELFVFRGKLTSKVLNEISENVDGDTVKIFSILAKKYKVFILLGSIYEKSKNLKKIYNTSVLINDKGNTIAQYRKINLFDAIVDGKKIQESKFFLKGKNLITAKVGDFKVGLSICYDVRFSELYKEYKNKKVDIVCVPAAFTKTTGEAHWEILIRARAIEGLCYVLAPNQVGKDNRGRYSYGHSMIVDPWGKILKEAKSNKAEILFAELDKNQIKNNRKALMS